MKRLLIGGAAGALLAALAGLYLLWWGPGPKTGPHHLVVAEGSTLRSATDYLTYAGAIDGQRPKFYWLARLLGEGDPIQAGEFA
ncbi:MAG: hypothetical protein ABIR60_08900, partial [Allosphingosinicella sp.]